MQKIQRIRRISNPRRKTSAKRRNPYRLLMLGATNPRKKRSTSVTRRKTTRRRVRRNSSATSRRRARVHTSSPRRVVRRRRRTTAAAPRRRRRISASPVRRRRNVSVRRVRRVKRRNPSLFGSRVNATQMTQAVVGGLIGVTAAKTLPTFLPANMTATPIMRILSSGAAAFLAGWVGARFNQTFGDAVLFGGLMQAGSVALSTFVPSVGGAIGLSGGLGELVAGAYPVPQNPLNPQQLNYPGRPMAVADTYGNGANVGVNGLRRSFRSAF